MFIPVPIDPRLRKANLLVFRESDGMRTIELPGTSATSRGLPTGGMIENAGSANEFADDTESLSISLARHSSQANSVLSEQQQFLRQRESSNPSAHFDRVGIGDGSWRRNELCAPHFSTSSCSAPSVSSMNYVRCL